MFKCPICGGKAETSNTKREDDVVIRKCKCKDCKQYFFTKEEFWKYTEKTVRNAGQKVTTRERSNNINYAINDKGAFFAPGESLSAAYARHREEGQVKERLVGIRTPGSSWQDVVQGKPLKLENPYKEQGLTPEEWAEIHRLGG